MMKWKDDFTYAHKLKVKGP